MLVVYDVVVVVVIVILLALRVVILVLAIIRVVPLSLHKFTLLLIVIIVGAVVVAIVEAVAAIGAVAAVAAAFIVAVGVLSFSFHLLQPFKLTASNILGQINFRSWFSHSPSEIMILIQWRTPVAFATCHGLKTSIENF